MTKKNVSERMLNRLLKGLWIVGGLCTSGLSIAVDTDTDGDGFSDEYEVSRGADPLDKNSIPKSGVNILLIKAALDLKNAKEESCLEPDCANSATPPTTYSYDRINGTYTNKLWDSVSVGRFTDLYQRYLVDYSTDSEVALTESKNAIDVNISATKLFEGTTVSYKWPVTNQNTVVTPLYSTDDPDMVIAYSGVQSFANADIGILSYSLDYLASKNISYSRKMSKLMT